MKNSRYNPVLVVIVLIGLLFSLVLNWQRHQVEQANRTVEQAIEYESVLRLAQTEGISINKALSLLKERGITTLILFDSTLEKLGQKGKVSVVTGADLITANSTSQVNSGKWLELLQANKIDPDALYVSAGTSPEALADVEEDAVLRFGKKSASVISQEPKIIEIKGDTTLIKDYSKPKEQRGIWYLDLGISTEELRIAKELGFNVFLRPVNYAYRYNDDAASAKEQIDSFFKRIDKSGANITALTGSGDAMLGYGYNLKYVADELLKRDITLAMIESVVQLQFAPLDGVVEMAELMNYHVARTYVIDKFELKKITVDDAVRRWDLTDEERNVRINYLKNIAVPDKSKTLMATNLDYFSELTQRVVSRGFTLGRAGVFTPYHPNHLMFIPVLFGILAAGMLYLTQLLSLSKKRQYTLLITAGIILSCIIMFSRGLLVRQMLALLAATTIPVLSMSYILTLWDKYKEKQKSTISVLFAATWQLCLAVMLSLVGGSFVASILGDIRFLLEIDIYKGVKLTFLLPIIFMGLLYAKRYYFQDQVDLKTIITTIKSFWTRSITVKTVFALAILAVIGWVFIGRSGHTAGVPVSALELKIRFFLEDVMFARPRSKEFAIGHPLFYLAAFTVYNKYPKLLQVVFITMATIAQGSLVQTFAHMRTPIIMSYIRALDGLFLGAVLGMLLLVVFAFIYPRIDAWQRRYLFHE